jgi:hypothetical protein
MTDLKPLSEYVSLSDLDNRPQGIVSLNRDGRDFTAKPETAPKLHIVSASSFVGVDVPVRSWLARDLIPDRTVTMLSGDGGVGKSLLAIQLGVAVAAARNGWIGVLTLPLKNVSQG